MQKIFLIAGLSLVLMGCASKPKEVNASLFLVSQQDPVGDVIPERYDSLLNDSTSQSVFIEDMAIQTKAFYFSALGNQCRTIQVIKNDKMQTRSACLYVEKEEKTEKDTQRWYLIPSIIKPTLNVSF